MIIVDELPRWLLKAEHGCCLVEPSIKWRSPVGPTFLKFWVGWIPAKVCKFMNRNHINPKSAADFSWENLGETMRNRLTTCDFHGLESTNGH